MGCNASDSRIKKNITDSDLGLDFINKLRPIKYNFVNPADWPEPLLENRFKGDNPDSRPKDNTSIYDGLIAQEVEEALKQLEKHGADIMSLNTMEDKVWHMPFINCTTY